MNNCAPNGQAEAAAGRKRPLLTIVTPVFNGVAFVEQCAENVANQGPEPIEHLFMDGGSLDGTVEMLESLGYRYPHIRFQSGPDGGQSSALNKGIRLARADVIGILNVDDYYEPGILGRVVDLFRGVDEPTLLVGNCNVRNHDGSISFINRPRRLRPWQLLLGTELVQFPLNPSAYFYHRCIHEIVGEYAEDEHYAMDLDFLLRASRAVSIRYVDETWGNFWLREGCKTVEGGASGVAIPQRDAVYARHRRMLPPVQRFLVTRVAGISESRFGETVRFVWRRPDLAVQRLGVRIRRLLGP